MKSPTPINPILVALTFILTVGAPTAYSQNYDAGQSAAAASGSFGAISPSSPTLASTLDAHDLSTAASMVGSTGTFRGVVSKVYMPKTNDLVILDFDPNYRTALTAIIQAQNFTRFPSLDPLVGKSVVVTGTFENYQRKIQVLISDPSQIKILTDSVDGQGTAGADIDWADAPEIKAPGALTVLAASDEAALNWFPIKDAATYAVERTTFEDADPKIVAAGLTGSAYFDRGLKPSERYEYVLCGLDRKGAVVAKEIATVAPQTGAAVFVDPLTDWSNADDHSANLAFATSDGVPYVKRNSSDMGTITYNLPGTVEFSFEVNYQKDLGQQVALETSTDGNSWTPQSLQHTEPVQASATDMLTICSPVSLPPLTNFVRIDLNGPDVDGLRIGAVRASYGRTGGSQVKTASTAH